MVARAAGGPDRNAAASARRMAGGAARRPLCRAPGQGVLQPADTTARHGPLIGLQQAETETADGVPRLRDVAVATLTACRLRLPMSQCDFAFFWAESQAVKSTCAVARRAGVSRA